MDNKTTTKDHAHEDMNKRDASHQNQMTSKADSDKKMNESESKKQSGDQK